jgi:hypothetical protein
MLQPLRDVWGRSISEFIIKPLRALVACETASAFDGETALIS